MSWLKLPAGPGQHLSDLLGIRSSAMEGFGGVSEGGKCRLSRARLCCLGAEALLLPELQAGMASSCFLMVSRWSLP